MEGCAETAAALCKGSQLWAVAWLLRRCEQPRESPACTLHQQILSSAAAAAEGRHLGDVLVQRSAPMTEFKCLTCLHQLWGLCCFAHQASASDVM